MENLCRALIVCFLSTASWLTPQPKFSEGLLVLYGSQNLVDANAIWHHYPTGECGASSLSPVMLGRLVRFSVDRMHWTQPCRIVDVGGRDMALLQVIQRHEIAEVDKNTAMELGFTHGSYGYAFFSSCLPGPSDFPESYAPPLVVTDDSASEYSGYPYPRPEMPAKCLPGMSQ